MYLYTAFVLCCTLAVVAVLIAIGRSFHRYRAGTMPRRAYLRDCLSNAGIALVALYFVLTYLSALVAPARLSAAIWAIGFIGFFAGVICVATGFWLLVRENRHRRA
jgi:cytochrome bd-type quinol oxidase subunit 2